MCGCCERGEAGFAIRTGPQKSGKVPPNQRTADVHPSGRPDRRAHCRGSTRRLFYQMHHGKVQISEIFPEKDSALPFGERKIHETPTAFKLKSSFVMHQKSKTKAASLGVQNFYGVLDRSYNDPWRSEKFEKKS